MTRRTILESPTLKRDKPPGQTWIRDFPIYDIVQPRPQFEPAIYRFRIAGAVKHPQEWTWEDLKRLPQIEVVADFHCVTRWSKNRLHWTGIPTRVIWEAAEPKPEVAQVMALSLDGYTANIPVAYFLADDSLLALALDGKPLTPEHGAPVRLVVPQLYAWKSAKYLCGLRFDTDLQPGFWEQRGYHLIGDPWLEQRFWEPMERVREVWRRIRKTTVERSDKTNS